MVEQVRAALPARLAQAVTSAGIDHDRLTIGVVGAVWASRIRYFTDPIRKSLAAALALEVSAVRIRVVQPIA